MPCGARVFFGIYAVRQLREVHMTGKNKVIILLLAAFLFSGASIYAEDSQDALSNLAAQIAEKRAEVESLSSRLSLVKTDYNEQLRSLATQQTDIETQIKREELRLEQVRRDISEYEARLRDNRASMQQIRPVLIKALGGLSEYTAKGLPFQVDERLLEIDRLEKLTEDSRTDPGMLLARIWNLIESEFRLTSESGIYRQTIIVEGESQLVEVARLGMALMYFRTFDGRYGAAVPESGGWRYVYINGREEVNQVDELFTAIRKNLREGYFELPNPLSIQD